MPRPLLTKWRLWLVALALTFGACATLTARNRGVGELRDAAAIVARWDSRDRSRVPSPSELEALPERARFMIDAQCNREGGDPRARRNCYGEAAAWMLDDAKEREPRRDLGIAGMAAAVLLGVASGLARRAARRREQALEA